MLRIPFLLSSLLVTSLAAGTAGAADRRQLQGTARKKVVLTKKAPKTMGETDLQRGREADQPTFDAAADYDGPEVALPDGETPLVRPAAARRDSRGTDALLDALGMAMFGSRRAQDQAHDFLMDGARYGAGSASYRVASVRGPHTLRRTPKNDGSVIIQFGDGSAVYVFPDGFMTPMGDIRGEVARGQHPEISEREYYQQARPGE